MISLKDEYEKKHDFYDEYHEDGGSEKHGGWHEEHEGKKGGHEKKGYLRAGHHEVITRWNRIPFSFPFSSLLY